MPLHHLEIMRPETSVKVQYMPNELAASPIGVAYASSSPLMPQLANQLCIGLRQDLDLRRHMLVCFSKSAVARDELLHHYFVCCGH